MQKLLLAVALISLSIAGVVMLLSTDTPLPEISMKDETLLHSLSSMQDETREDADADPARAHSGSLVSEPPSNLAPLWVKTAGADGSNQYELAANLSELSPSESFLITLPSGSSYELRIDEVSQNDQVFQSKTRIMGPTMEGFGLLTQVGDSLVGTLNTPEGVFELFGGSANLRIERASDIDGSRREGIDYRIREPSTPVVPTKPIFPPVKSGPT